ncbi:MAG TPA: shikimate kinase [Phycisphaerae bacterium]|nr:shikimate kinase [Phycisphaerae bacterium]
MNVVLIGMKHCGKSTLGAALARRWACPFHDVDRMIEQTYACDAGETLTVRELFARHGEQRFRQIESHVVCELYLKLDEPDATNVVALGGRTATNAQISQLLAGIGLVVYLKVPNDELVARLRASGLPSFVDRNDPVADFLDLCRQREPIYGQLADRVVELDALGVDQALDHLIHRIEEHEHAR